MWLATLRPPVEVNGAVTLTGPLLPVVLAVTLEDPVSGPAEIGGGGVPVVVGIDGGLVVGAGDVAGSEPPALVAAGDGDPKVDGGTDVGWVPSEVTCRVTGAQVYPKTSGAGFQPAVPTMAVLLAVGQVRVTRPFSPK